MYWKVERVESTYRNQYQYHSNGHITISKHIDTHVLRTSKDFPDRIKMADHQIVGLNVDYNNFIQIQANDPNANASTSALSPPIFYLYKGGPIPLHVTHIRIDKSINEIPDEVFSGRDVQEVELHNEVSRIGKLAFYNCRCLRRLSGATGVRVIDEGAFYRCKRLRDLEFGSKKLERVGVGAFSRCASLLGLKIPSVKIVDGFAFQYCVNMTNVDFGEGLEQVKESTFLNCYSLRRVAMPLKAGLIRDNDVFQGCRNMASVELVGEVHDTICHFSLQIWRDEMNEEIDQINRVLSTLPSDGKALAVRQWIGRVLARVDHFEKEHNRFLEESATILELASWRHSLNGEIDDDEPKNPERIDIDVDSVRQEKRMMCGANVVVKNVLSFLQLK